MKLAAFPDDLVAAARREAADLLGGFAGRGDITGKIAGSYDAFRERSPPWSRVSIEAGLRARGGVNIHPRIPAKAGIQGHLLRLKELDSRWSLYSGRPKAGPEYGNERGFYLRLTDCSR